MNLGEEVVNDTKIESQSFQFQGSFLGLVCGQKNDFLGSWFHNFCSLFTIS